MADDQQGYQSRDEVSHPSRVAQHEAARGGSRSPPAQPLPPPVWWPLLLLLVVRRRLRRWAVWPVAILAPRRPPVTAPRVVHVWGLGRRHVAAHRPAGVSPWRRVAPRPAASASAAAVCLVHHRGRGLVALYRRAVVRRWATAHAALRGDPRQPLRARTPARRPAAHGPHRRAVPAAHVPARRAAGRRAAGVGAAGAAAT